MQSYTDLDLHLQYVCFFRNERLYMYVIHTLHIDSAEPRVYLGIPFTRVTVNSKIFDFDNPRSLEKAISGKELHRKLLLLTKNY